MSLNQGDTGSSNESAGTVSTTNQEGSSNHGNSDSGDVQNHNNVDEQSDPQHDKDGDLVLEDIPKTQQELIHEARLEILRSINPQPDYPWKYLTVEDISDLDRLSEDLSVLVSGDIQTAESVFFEIIYSAQFHTERLPIQSLSKILNFITDSEKSEILSLKFLSVFNTFKLDHNLSGLLKGYQRLSSVNLGKYLLDDDTIKSENVINDYSRHKIEYTLGLVTPKIYNLLTESNEGYAKVVTLLNETISSEDAYFQVDYTLKSIQILIGHFNLDPNRVLDIILDIFINSISKNYRFCFDLLKRSQWWPTNNEADNSSLETLNKGGNEVAAKLIGAKLKHYTESGKDLTETFKILIPLLIKIGFVSFGSVLKYIGPDDNAMNDYSEEVSRKIEDEIFKASANALALSGPLVDDEDDQTGKSQPNSRPSTQQASQHDTASTVNKDLNQKLHITKMLLANGLYYPSIYMLSKYPFLVDADDEFPQFILRLFHVIIQPLKKKLEILEPSQVESLTTAQETAFTRKSALNDDVVFEANVSTEIEVFKPLRKNHSNKHFIYFYREWTDGVPQAETVDDLIKYSQELLSFIGAKLGQDAQLVTILARLGVQDLENNDETEEYDAILTKWFEFFRKFLFPSSTYLHENPVTTFDLFQLLKKFPLQWRYNLYGELHNVTSKNDNFVRLNYSKAEKQTKNSLKRITTENVKPMMRRLAKITYSNPLPAFLVIVSQVESYDNLTDLIVQSARYFTDYAWDVLPFVLLMRLTTSKQAVQSDGLNDSLWLQSLSTFIAKLAKTYASFNLEPIFSYIVKDLHNSNTTGLTLLREIVNQMGGIQQNSNLSSNQIKLLNSSEALQTIVRKIIRDTRDVSERSAGRLLKTLEDSNQLSELLLLLADSNQNIIENSDENSHYKVLSSQKDEITAVLHTYIELITYFLRDAPERFIDSVLSIEELVNKYRVESTWVFELWRNFITQEKNLNSLDFVDVDFTNLTRELYIDFWKLKLYDIDYDQNRYDIEKARLEEANRSVQDQITSLTEGNTRDDYRHRNNRENQKLVRELNYNKSDNTELIEKLEANKLAHKEHHESTYKYLEDRYTVWFTDDITHNSQIQSFIQFALIPRALHSESDAVYAGKFLTKVLNVETGANVLHAFFDAEILDTLIYTITPSEAENLGLFFAEILAYYEDLRIKEDTSNEYKKFIYSWHQKILESVEVNVESENYMTRRNSITFLKNLIQVYPVIEDHGEKFIEDLKQVSLTESRNDLKLASDAILAHITARSKKWIHLWDFYEFTEDEKTELITAREALLKEREEKKLQEKRLAAIRAQEASRPQSRISRSSTEEASAAVDDKTSLGDSDQESKERNNDEDGDQNEELNDIEVEQKIEESNETTNGDEDEDEDEDEEAKLEEDDTYTGNVKAKDDSANEEVKDATHKSASSTKEEETISKNSQDEENSNTENANEKELSSDGLQDLVTKSQNSDPAASERPRGRFKDVTAVSNPRSPSTSSPAPQDKKLPLSVNQRAAHLKSIYFDLEAGDLTKVIILIEERDTAVAKKLRNINKLNATLYVREVKNIVENYAKGIAYNTPEFRAFKNKLSEDSLEKLRDSISSKVEKPVLPSGPSGTSRPYKKQALPPQESVTGYQSRPAQKWGTGNRNYDGQSQRGYDSHYQQPSNRGQYNQGYRSSSNNSPIPNRPPQSSYTPSSSSTARGRPDNKRSNTSNYSDSYGDKRQRR